MPIKILLKVTGTDPSAEHIRERGKKVYVQCEILGLDRSYHALKELERAKLFERLRKYISDNLADPALPINYAFGASQSEILHAFGQTKTIKPQVPKPTSVGIEIDENSTLEDVKRFFKDNFDCEIHVVNDYGIRSTPKMTFKEYAEQVDEAWYAKVDKEYAPASEISSGKIPNIEEYNKFVRDVSRYNAQSKSHQDTAKRVFKRGAEQSDLNWVTTFSVDNAVEQAIVDEIFRMEQFDEEGNLPKCPITLTPFEAHEKVILILSRNPKDGLLHASFVHAERREKGTKTNIEDYLRNTLKKDPITNDPIVAMEVGTLADIKSKYRRDISRPFL